MPRHAYTPRKSPPSLWDKILFNSFELGYAAAFAIAGIILLVDVFMGDSFTPSPSMAEPTWWAELLVAAVLLLSTASLLRALLIDTPHVDKDWLIERIGLLSGGIGLLGYAGAVLVSSPHALLAWVFPLMLAVPCGLRIWATIKEEDRRRAEVATLHRDEKAELGR